MKKVKKAIKVAGIIILIILTFLALQILIIRKIIAKKCVNDTLKAFATGDYTDDFYYVNINGDIQDYLNIGILGDSVLRNTTFEPDDYDFDLTSPIATVTLNVSYPNIQEVYEKEFADATEVIPSETIQKELLSAIKAKEFSTVNETVKVDIIQYKNKWYMIENEELLNTYSGGLYAQYKQVIAETFENKEG